jgi:hypothetical protein
MIAGARAVAGIVAFLSIAGFSAGGSSGRTPGHADHPHTSTRPAAARKAPQRLVVSLGQVDPRIRRGADFSISGTVSNPTDVEWLDAQVYLQTSQDPARSLRDLNEFAKIPANRGFGNTVLTYGLFDQIGDIPPGGSRAFDVTVPYSALPISGQPGVYRIGVKVVAGTSAGRNPAAARHASTLVPLLPADPARLTPVPTVTLLPLTAPVKRLLGGAFADDSLATSISFGGRLYDTMEWALHAPPQSLEIAVDPALLDALDDMSHGYQVRPPHPGAASQAGQGEAAAVTWLINFDQLLSQQSVMLLPWGVPAVNSLLANRMPGPAVAAVRASEQFGRANQVGDGVIGWLTGGGTGLRAVRLLRHSGVGLQVVSQASLPGLSAGHRPTRGLPSVVSIETGSRPASVLLTAKTRAGLPTLPRTSALQVRQRLIADATVRSLSSDLDQVRVTALPFRWDPGPNASTQGLDRAFSQPVLIEESAADAMSARPRSYSGVVRPGPESVALPAGVVSAIRTLHHTGGPLAAILVPARSAQSQFDRTFAMAASGEWRTFPLLGDTLISRRASLAQAQLAKVTVTGPPFVAMSSTTGRFPLTVTNGLDRDINVRLAVTPQDPALAVGPLGVISLPAGERRDIAILSTAEGSGVTSVRARLATPEDVRFGRAWRFDVRATQIGLVIWVAMGVGGAILFLVSGFRIVNRLRGRQPSRGRAAP